MFLPVSYVIEYRKGNTGKTRKQKIINLLSIAHTDAVWEKQVREENGVTI